MKRKILFDLDGTLTDSGEGIIKSAVFGLEHFGLPIPPWEKLKAFVGPPLTDTFAKFGVAPRDLDEAVAVYRQRYNTVGKFENAPYPGIGKLLQSLRARGHRLYVATSKPQEVSEEILAHFGLAPYFDIIAGAGLDERKSSKSAIIAGLLERIGADGALVMVGDTVFDILGARAHGIPAVGVSWGYGSVPQMEEAGAAAIAHSMEELFSLLDGAKIG